MPAAVKTVHSEPSKEKYLDKVIPTLYIGVGGTGAEVLFKLRRKILTQVWSGGSEATRLESLNEFPFAEFMHIDLDSSTVVETGRSGRDPLQAQVAFKASESYVKKLDLGKYIGSDEKLRSFPLVEEWFPLSSQKIQALNINPEKGAGQIRSISRLYFFDRYQDIKSAIDQALSNLRNSVNNTDKHKRLGLTLEAGALRVVVVASTAGGTGSGAFIDVGYLSKILLDKCGAASKSVTSILMLPTGFKGANAGRTQANTYAALMELETCMRGGASHVERWSESDPLSALPTYPYDDIYLLDTENLAYAKTEKAVDCFQMVADVLFEDFSTADFSNKKRSISVNQNLHKVLPYTSRVDPSKYGDLKLTYSRSYSAFGQAILDTQVQQKQSSVVERQVARMLGVFFGVSAEQGQSNVAQPTETDRDEMLERLHLKWSNEVVDYDFSCSSEKFKHGDEVSIATLVTELLRVDGRLRLDDIKAGIERRFDEVKNAGDHKAWPDKLQELLKQFRRETIKGIDAGSGLHEEGIRKRQVELRKELMSEQREAGLIPALWALVDNKEKGGLDFTIALIHLIKDQIENAETGLAKRLEDASRRFADLAGFVNNDEIDNLKKHLEQAVDKFFSARSQSEAKWQQLSEAVKLFVVSYMQSVACREAAALVRQLSQDLGRKSGTDSLGEPIWDGFIGELERGRQNVLALMTNSEKRIESNTEAMKQSHAMFQVLPAPASSVDELNELKDVDLREWALEVFENLGGTRDLYKMIEGAEGGSELCAKLRNQAIAKILLRQRAIHQGEAPNPLFAALDALHPNERKSMLVQTMQRAMPWAPLKLDGYLKDGKPEEQYICLIGVKDCTAFEKRYGDLMMAAIPPGTKMSSTRAKFVEIGEPGRLVCYVELSGLPLPAIRPLPDWYASYKIADKEIPTHAHKQVSKFVHVIEMNEAELSLRYNDLKLMLQALALRDLSRSPKRDENGRLRLKINGGERSVGDERVIRLNGFDGGYRAALQEKVENSQGFLKNLAQREIWYLLMLYYYENVYPIWEKTSEDNTTRTEKHLPTLVCENLLDQARSALVSLGKSEAEILALKAKEPEMLFQWTDEISGSESDPYPHEVGGPEGAKLRPKRALKMEVFDENWSYTNALPSQFAKTTAAPAPVVPAHVLPPAPQGFAAMPTPVAIPTIQWYLNVNGTNYGPFAVDLLRSMIPTGQFGAQTMVWREGMPAWLPACTVPDLATLFTPAAVMPPPINTAMPPPVSVAPPFPPSVAS